MCLTIRTSPGCTIDDPTWLEKASHMFGVNTVDMSKALIKPRIKVGSEYVHKGQNAQQVKDHILRSDLESLPVNVAHQIIDSYFPFSSCY